MNKEQMLSKIYEVIADKTLSLGCITLLNEGDYRFGYVPCGDGIRGICLSNPNWVTSNEIMPFSVNTEFLKGGVERHPKDHIKIIGHPVMIGDVLDWVYENDTDQVELHKIIKRKGKDTNFTYTPASVMVISLWKEKRKPIDDQSDETIKFVFGLLPKK